MLLTQPVKLTVKTAEANANLTGEFILNYQRKILENVQMIKLDENV